MSKSCQFSVIAIAILSPHWTKWHVLMNIYQGCFKMIVILYATLVHHASVTTVSANAQTDWHTAYHLHIKTQHTETTHIDTQN